MSDSQPTRNMFTMIVEQITEKDGRKLTDIENASVSEVVDKLKSICEHYMDKHGKIEVQFYYDKLRILEKSLNREGFFIKIFRKKTYFEILPDGKEVIENAEVIIELATSRNIPREFSLLDVKTAFIN